MKATLKDIQRGISTLNKLAQIEFPARHIKLAFKIKRIFEGASKEFEASRAELNKLVKEYGVEVFDGEGKPIGAWQVLPENAEKFNALAEDFLSPTVELWGEPFTLDDLEKAGDLIILSAADLIALDWLIVESLDAATVPVPLTLGASAD